MTGPGWLLGSLIVLVSVAIVASTLYSFTSSRPKTTDQAGQNGPGLVRSMLALVLVGGLMLLTGASFNLAGDTQTRNLLVGGVIASASAAVAFYFASRSADAASRSADAARRDVLKAALGTESVPNLVGLTISAAQAAMSGSSLVLALPDQLPPPPADPTIVSQDPAAGTSVAKGTAVSITV